MLRITIETGNDAFQGNQSSLDHELSNLLEGVKNAISFGHEKGKIVDSNGNSCGNWSFSLD
jgi:hypothetical protein